MHKSQRLKKKLNFWGLLTLLLTLGCLGLRPRATSAATRRASIFFFAQPAALAIHHALQLRLSSVPPAPIFSVDLLAYQTTPLFNDFSLIDIFYLYNRSAYCVIFRTGAGRPLVANSLDRFFFNYWWSEREASEHFGLFFPAKVDMRNLLLDYTWSLNPLLKLFPSVGFVEVFFDSLGGRLFHQKITYQI